MKHYFFTNSMREPFKFAIQFLHALLLNFAGKVSVWRANSLVNSPTQLVFNALKLMGPQLGLRLTAYVPQCAILGLKIDLLNKNGKNMRRAHWKGHLKQMSHSSGLGFVDEEEL